jgi:aminotransferase
MVKLHQYGIMSAPTMSQYAAIEAMKYGDEDIQKMQEEYDGRRRFLLQGFWDMGLECFEPKGAFYMFPCIRSTGMNSDEFCTEFLKAEQVAVIPGSAFGPGGEGFVRCCYAASMKDLDEALKRMKRFIDSRK